MRLRSESYRIHWERMVVESGDVVGTITSCGRTGLWVAERRFFGEALPA